MTNDNGVQISSDFEKFLFGFTRVFALGGSLIAILGVVVLLLFSLFGWGGEDSFVKLTDLKPTQQTESADSTLPKFVVELPENVRKYLNDPSPAKAGNNVQVLYGWIESLDKKDQKDFIENLSSIIAEAEANGEVVVDVINDYKTAKLSKLQNTEFEKYEKAARRGAMVGAMFGLTLFIALMSLILVTLAVERNTRKN